MATTWTWEQIITNIEGISTKTTGSSSQTGTNRWDVNGTDGAWMYIPENGYYTTGYKVTIPWAQIKSKLGNASDGHVLTGIKYSSQNGIMRTGNIANNGKTDHTFTPSKDKQTWGIPTGYHNGGVVTCNPVTLSGNADTGQVLSGYTFYKDSMTKKTGTIVSKTNGTSSVTASGSWGLNTTNGFWINIPSNAYYTTGHNLSVPWNTCKDLLESTVGTRFNYDNMIYYNVGTIAGDNGTETGWADIARFDVDIAIPSGVRTILVEFIAVGNYNWIDTSKYNTPDIQVTGGTVIKEMLSVSKGHQNGSHAIRFISRSYAVTEGSRLQTIGPNKPDSNTKRHAACELKVFY